ncbi:flavin reductase family protein [Nocardia sp. NPDC050408]|uniref:flavin reductase family protein n=1 Tax=Nocardia sp. NPDC050408 TaxID=3364319 RepID=UPI00378E4AFD
MPDASIAPTPPDATPLSDVEFREAVAHFCSGITVLTATVDGAPVGMTCQSFFSLSIDPMLVAFSVAKTSTTYPVIRAAGRCCVNVLAHDQAGVSRQFARSGTDKWSGIRWDHSRHLDNPVIDGVLAWFDCEIETEYEGGDHLIILGKVRGLGARSEARPLLYYRSAYAHLEHGTGERATSP